MEIMNNSNQPWELDTRHLLALVAIARTRSVSRAAEELGYGQSAVSQQLAALEKTVGVRLVDRGTGPKPVQLTEAGNVLLRHATSILERLAAARSDLESLDAGTSGSIRIGTFQSAGARLLPKILADYRRTWPAISIHLHTETFDGELAALLRDGALDVAFVEESSVGVGLDHVHLLTDKFVALVPPTHRFASLAAIHLHDFESEDMIEGESADACTIRAERAFRNIGVEPRVVFRTDDNPTRQRLVDAGLGSAVLPGLTVEAGLPNGAVVVPLIDELARRISLAWASDRTKSRALDAFIETATRLTFAEVAPNQSAPTEPVKRKRKRIHQI
jgi:DNA-binding transcriptional LysR family regulator